MQLLQWVDPLSWVTVTSYPRGFKEQVNRSIYFQGTGIILKFLLGNKILGSWEQKVNYFTYREQRRKLLLKDQGNMQSLGSGSLFSSVLPLTMACDAARSRRHVIHMIWKWHDRYNWIYLVNVFNFTNTAFSKTLNQLKAKLHIPF